LHISGKQVDIPRRQGLRLPGQAAIFLLKPLI
jgi:hypothetical protein